MNNKKHDIVEKLSCGSLIQHGEFNDRIYLMKASPDASDDLPKILISMAKRHDYSKVFAKIPEDQAKKFYDAGFKKEAAVPEFYESGGHGVFLAFYLRPEREHEEKADLYSRNIELAFGKQNQGRSKAMNSERFSLRACNENDVERMAEIYKIVFASYPFPIHKPEYILETMQDNVDYFCIENNGVIIALASSEKDMSASNVEMTDFATLPEWRGNGLAVHLLKHMEGEMEKQGIKTAYTIARAASPGMNITFSKLGYSFGGRLKNNTNISGTIESMNVWYKHL